MASLHQLYIEEIKRERGKFLSKPDAIFTESDIAPLPKPVQRYFRYCGYIGKEKRLYARIPWKDVEMRFTPGGRWRRLECYQFNAVPDPVRIVHMKTIIAGILPFEARDKYQDGRGNMLIRLFSFLTVQNFAGKEMDESALVTLLAEALLIPAYALQPYIEWSAAGPDRAAAAIRFNGTEVQGMFYFNGAGELMRFETLHRWRAEKGGQFRRVPWRTLFGGYGYQNGIRRPFRVSAAWLEVGGWEEYYRGEIGDNWYTAPV